MDIDNAGDQAFLINTPAQAEYLLSSLVRAASGIDFCADSDKTELMSFKQNEAISS